jgi:hypothetical protein
MMSGFNPGPRELYQGSEPHVLHVHAQEIGALKAEVSNLKGQLSDIDAKLSQLVDAANMGKGAWWMTVKLGGVLVTISAGAAWLWQSFSSAIIWR